jgi:inorganic triphosphatase YgiF
MAGSRSTTLVEVELELKTGQEGDLAIKLAEEFPLRLEFISKAQQGFELATGESPPAAKATSLNNHPDATLDDAVVAVVSNALEHSSATGSLCAQPASRRRSTRRGWPCGAALKIFRHALPCPQFNALPKQTRQLASEFGPTRECDVFLESMAGGPFADASRPAGYETLLSSVKDRRTAAFG